jgi:ubiquinone/menaquinone biosynthesis C-methylase UbiE
MSDRFLSPKEVVEQYGLFSQMAVADFGCGSGDFSIAIAKIIGNGGRVYSIDVLQACLQSLRSKAKIEGISNIDLIRADLEIPKGSTIPDSFLDLVLLHNILFQVKDKKSFLEEAHRVLKVGGKLAIMEWSEFSPIGPVRDNRIVDKDMIKVVKSMGFDFVQNTDAGRYHYGQIYRKV